MASERKLTVEELGGRTVVSTGTPWEPVIGYSRAVRRGPAIAVTGTIGLEGDGTCPASAARQMRLALETIVAAVEALGGVREDVVRTRIFVTDISLWEEIGRVHGEFFGDLRPATTMVQVSRFVLPEAVVEVEADAFVETA